MTSCTHAGFVLEALGDLKIDWKGEADSEGGVPSQLDPNLKSLCFNSCISCW